VPANIVTRWVGVDKRDLPRTGRPLTANPSWMGTLIANSNLTFTGAYVTGPALSGQGITPSDFTGSSKAISRAWMPNMATLTGQGWGAAFFYVGYSVGGGEPAPATGVDTARGTLHGRHLRTIITALGPSFAGAVVFIDNEDSTSTTLPSTLIDYYNGLFTEMVRPDPNLACCRPGLYGHGDPLTTMLRSRNELYLWDVWLDTGSTTTTVAPFGAGLPLTVDATTRPLKAYGVAPTTPGAQGFVTWSLGRQFRFYTGKMPQTAFTPPGSTATWTPIDTWDYDSCFVRNPAFPEAEPRIAVIPRAGQRLLVAGTFVPARAGPPMAPPMSQLTSLATGGSTAIPFATGVTAEPDAPSALFDAGNAVGLCTILNGGALGVGSLSPSGTWTAIDTMPGATPAIRRIRSLAACGRTNTESTVFYVGADNLIYVKRKQGTSPWEDAAAINNTTLHPFSRMVACARGSTVLELYYIDSAGLLTNSFFIVGGASTWPAFPGANVETSPSLLADGALAIIAPTADTVLVFGVGLDLRLAFAAFVQGQGFSGVLGIGAAQDLIAAHTRLAVNKVNDTTIEVAALTDAGAAAIYQFVRSGSTWTPQPRTVMADPPAVAGAIPAVPAGAVVQPANGFRINPYGDLALFRAPTAISSTLMCAGLRGGETHLLTCDLAPTATWQFFV
jgi:hypothetical protein